MNELNPFAKKVVSIIGKIPTGQVATYSQVSKLAGKSHGARGVSWILHACSKKYALPWHRVINRNGRISFQLASRNYFAQKRRLKAEGIWFTLGDRVDLRRYQWKP